MKVVLFCGGMGMRMREFSDRIPKPMVPIGTRPIIWHLMKYYAHWGHTDFVLCLGYKAEAFKEYFLNYKEWLSNDFVLSSGGRDLTMLNTDIDDWTITFVDTGIQANIGERLMAVREHVKDEELFLANYSDGLSDVCLPTVIDQARARGNVATFVLTTPSQTFHLVTADDDGNVTAINDSRQAGLWVNAGFFVLTPEVFDYMRPGEELVFEPFGRLMDAGELKAHRHHGFWAGMDTFKDRQELDDMHAAGNAPWEVWSAEVPV